MLRNFLPEGLNPCKECENNGANAYTIWVNVENGDDPDINWILKHWHDYGKQISEYEIQARERADPVWEYSDCGGKTKLACIRGWNYRNHISWIDRFLSIPLVVRVQESRIYQILSNILFLILLAMVLYQCAFGGGPARLPDGTYYSD